jgi:hypothetical protein
MYLGGLNVCLFEGVVRLIVFLSVEKLCFVLVCVLFCFGIVFALGFVATGTNCRNSAIPK